MGKGVHNTITILLAIMLWLGSACTPRQDVQGPRLISDVTLAPTDILPTRALSPTPLPVTPEIPSVLQMPTTNADFVLVTPTLPPSKTPTTTPTITLTPTLTLTPTITATSSATAFLLPTSVIIPVTSVVAVSNNQICDSNWFFLQPRPASCPLNAPNASNGVYQTFQNGTMIWVGSQDAIYVMYNDLLAPRWEVFRDYFEDGMPEESGGYSAPAPNLYQPRRGFGMLWRNSEAVRNRIGWATIQQEQPYSVQVQTSKDGSIFVSAPSANLFGLLPSGTGWTLYSMQSSGSVFLQTPTFIPIPTLIGQ
jgi:hypothetical protein